MRDWVTTYGVSREGGWAARLTDQPRPAAASGGQRWAAGQLGSWAVTAHSVAVITLISGERPQGDRVSRWTVLTFLRTPITVISAASAGPVCVSVYLYSVHSVSAYSFSIQEQKSGGSRHDIN